MTAPVFFAVLFAALLHASWNAVVKLGLDRFASMLVMALMQSGIALLLTPFFAPPAAAAMPWLLLGSALHTGYKLFLIRAYSHGDLSEVYPVSRGTAPLIVADVGLVALGETMTPGRYAAIAAIAGGILLMAGGGRGGASRRALAWALGTACFTAGYTMADGIGARLAQSVSGFALLLFVIDGLAMMTAGTVVRGPRAIGEAVAAAWRPGLATGAMSLGSYWIAIWAFTQAPLALVAALRETSVLFALLIGALFLGERVGPRRWLAAGLIGTGIVLIRL
ncbi:EamA family transporter [Sphingomonas parva]|uniref:EamA family transporter n=1 Tax=Sphingomonas parva TaxID=2555898 RepID=A0A4Y8ZSP1_9SPHN|nr:EamA family transporter [Sphingomonas parva]TFI57466.1 EamA family transporter [Sphingomonas parva]